MAAFRNSLLSLCMSFLSLPVVNALVSRAAANGTAGLGPVAANYGQFLRDFALEEARAAEPPGLQRLRRALFEQRTAHAAAHNAKPGGLWTASINGFADHTDEELRQMLGYRRGAGRRQMKMPSFLATNTAPTEPRPPQADLPKSVDWRGSLRTLRNVRSQGGCGSCWAIAAAGALESHAELAHGNVTDVSYDHLVHCVENPHRCGGNGGCSGATSELAFGFAMEQGVATSTNWYSSLLGDSACEIDGGERMFASGFVQLPTNEQQPLLNALAKVGPVVVSVDASNWFLYHSGVFDGCDIDAVVNHAVLATGYGIHRGVKYWLIRNSWGHGWGEAGYIRLLQASDEDSHCGTDRHPEEGVGCAGGPAEMRVCGVCGVLADSSYPTGVRLAAPAAGKASLRARRPHREAA